MRKAGTFVYVNQDGSVRELSRDEQRYLAQDFAGGDGGRPYVKAAYESRDGWGSLSGFLSRQLLPPQLAIEPVNPRYVPPAFDGRREALEDSHRLGDLVTHNADGSVSYAPNPELSPKARFEQLRQLQLERQRTREQLARHPDYLGKPTG